MLNQVVIMGRITADPDFREVGDSSVANFTVAVERDKAVNGERKTDFVDCTAWGKKGEFINNYFHKGNMIIVHGSLESRKWVDTKGNNRLNWSIKVDGVYFGEKKQPYINGDVDGRDED